MKECMMRAKLEGVLRKLGEKGKCEKGVKEMEDFVKMEMRGVVRKVGKSCFVRRGSRKNLVKNS